MRARMGRGLAALAMAATIALLAGCAQLSIEDVPLRRAGTPATPPAPPPPAGHGNLSIHAIDVGQGDAILVVTPSGATMLLDAGPRDASETVIAYLRAHGVAKLDVLVASHGDADHIGGVGVKEANVLDAFPATRVYEPGFPKTTVTYETFLDKVRATGAQTFDHRAFDPGDELPLDASVRVTFLAPDVVDPNGESNDEGIVLRVEYGNFSAIFPGDASASVETQLVTAGAALDATLLKVGHHGSRGSSTAEFLAAVTPELLVLSVSSDNSYGHPHAEALARLAATGATMHRTDTDGNVLVTTDGATWSVTAHA